MAWLRYTSGMNRSGGAPLPQVVRRVVYGLFRLVTAMALLLLLVVVDGQPDDDEENDNADDRRDQQGGGPGDKNDEPPADNDADNDHDFFFFNRTHYGFGEDFVYSTTSPISYALYASVVMMFLIVTGSIWFYGCPMSDWWSSVQRRRRDKMIHDSTKQENLLPVNPFAAVDELLERFHCEVKNSEILDDYDEEEQNSYTRSIAYVGDDDYDQDKDDNNNDDAASGDGRTARAKKRRPPVVDGYYSTTPDDLILEYNEDMYLEFIPIRGHENFSTIQGYGKYNDTGNVRVEGLVASTGEAYWYEVPSDPSSSSSGPVAIARGTFALRRPDRHHIDDDIGRRVQFVGHWYRPTGKRGGHYQLFSHKVVFPSSNATQHSVATPSIAAEEFSTTGEDDLLYQDGEDNRRHDNDEVDEVLLLRGGGGGSDDSSSTGHRHVVVYGVDGPGVSNLSNDDWSIDDGEIIETSDRHHQQQHHQRKYAA